MHSSQSPLSVARAESSATFHPSTQHPSFQEPANVQRANQPSRSCSASRWSSWRHFSSWFGSTSRTIRWFDTYLRAQRVDRAVLNGHRVQLVGPWQHSRPKSMPNEAPFEQWVVRVSPPEGPQYTTPAARAIGSSGPALTTGGWMIIASVRSWDTCTSAFGFSARSAVSPTSSFIAAIVQDLQLIQVGELRRETSILRPSTSRA